MENALSRGENDQPSFHTSRTHEVSDHVSPLKPRRSSLMEQGSFSGCSHLTGGLVIVMAHLYKVSLCSSSRLSLL